MLNYNSWKDQIDSISKNFKISQYEFYKKNDTPIEILSLVSMESKRFGSISEKILINLFELNNRTSTQNDGVRKNKKIEIKCARYWGGTTDCKWQHIEPEHDFEFIIFGLLDFDSWKCWIIDKKKLMNDCKEKKLITCQGEQGYWCNKNKIIDYLTEINNIQDLDNYLD